MASKTRRVCPSCGYDYEPWIEVCPDCGMLVETVIETKREPVDSGDPEWTVVTNVPNAIMGHLLKNQLEDAGIPVLMLRSSAADIAQFSHNDYVAHDLRVPRTMLARAEEIVYPTLVSPWDMPPEAADDDELSEDRDDDVEVDGRRYLSDESANVDSWTMLPPSGPLPWRNSAQNDAAPVPELADEDFSGYDAQQIPSRVRRTPAWNGENESARRIRLIYGVLLAAMSLPFFLQLLQQIASAFNR